MEFIDKHCIVFDTEDENKFEYTAIHKQFCEMVDNLLEGFLSDMGISPEEFAEVCQSPNAARLNEFVFNQILAVDDFLSFRKMMCKRTLELNVQAMSMLKMQEQQAQQAQAQPAASAAPPSPSVDMAQLEAEDPDLAAAIRLSKETFQQGAADGTDEDQELKKAIALSMTDSEVQSVRAKQEEAELAHAVALSQALEEQRLKAAAEEEERLTALAIESSRQEAEALARAEALAKQVAEREEAEKQASIDAAKQEAAQAALEAAREEQRKAAEQQALAHREHEAAQAKAAQAKLANTKMQEEVLARRAAGSLPPIGGKLEPLAPLSSDQRTMAADKTMARVRPVSSPQKQQKMELSPEELEARKAHLLAQRQKILEQNSAQRQRQAAEAAAQRQAKQAAAPAPEPEVASGPRVIAVKSRSQTSSQQRLTQALASQMRRDLLAGLK